ncbi:MAG: metal-dependent hydrolase [Pseudomonadota bacterium]
MHITWMGHGSYRVDTAGQVLLIDPWVDGNPSFPSERTDEAIAGATAILLTHGHFDHTKDSVDVAKRTGAPIYGMYELINVLAPEGSGVEGTGFNRGGTVMIGDVAVTLVSASHSSTIAGEAGIVPTGQECGFMISAEGKTLYAMGDTDIMADWEWMGELHAPDCALVPVGGHFTMDGKRAAWGISRYLPNLKSVVPGHYKTFPLLAQDAEDLKAGLPGVAVHELEVMGAPAEV